ncbi:MAG: DUF488 family protein [Deltaproteobacteria bacterium]|nr:DUF488 family protein [Deltaproteobacteria bacterium]
MIQIKRVYEPPLKVDGYRILVDRLWPRGLSKQVAKVDLWLKEVAPSDRLRKWFSHEVEKWEGFAEKYAAELKDKVPYLAQIKELEKQHGTVTLLFGARDAEHNQALVLWRVLRKK